MCNGPAFYGTRLVVRFAFAGMTAALLAGCADSSRFIGDPLGNPFKSASADPLPAANYDMAPPPYSPMRTPSVSSRPLAPPSGLPSRHVASYDAPAHSSPRLAQSYAAPATDRTASIGAPSGHGSWTTAGGMSVIAGTGETASMLADRYNVPTETLLNVNGLSAADVRPGTRLIIPVYNANGAAPARSAPRVASAERKPHDHSSRAKLLAMRDPEKHAVAKHDVAERETPRHETGKHEAKHEVAGHEKMHWVKGPQPAKVATDDKHAKPAPKAKKTANGDSSDKPIKTAKVEPKEKAPKVIQPVVREKANVDPTPTASLPPADEKVAQGDSPEFRWPAHGRIIQGFKSGGNDGINIAVPEGTSVKAAESGVVAYAGSEIKGFGNLVLIRHPNGYVTAYANNSDLSVHRGEQVKRGQIIAKSGQSGNVASPQLHFELRKGSTPVDPTRYLAGL